MKNTLYGDGVHDDTLAIQEMLDTMNEIELPIPENFYLISKSLEIGSNKRLTLPKNATIKLKDGSKCVMIKNENVNDLDTEKAEKACHYSAYISSGNVGHEGGDLFVRRTLEEISEMFK